MKFKKSHTVDYMITTAAAEDDGYFQVHYPGTEDVLAVQVRRGPITKVTWWREPPGASRAVEITRSAAIRVLDSWREKS